MAGLFGAIVVGTAAAMAGLIALYRIEVEAKGMAKKRGDDLAVAKEMAQKRGDDLAVANTAIENESQGTAKGQRGDRGKEPCGHSALEEIEVANGLPAGRRRRTVRGDALVRETVRGDQGPPQMEEIHRLRIALYARHTPRATLIQLLPDQHLKMAVFSPDGRWILTAGGHSPRCGIRSPGSRCPKR